VGAGEAVASGTSRPSVKSILESIAARPIFSLNTLGHFIRLLEKILCLRSVNSLLTRILFKILTTGDILASQATSCARRRSFGASCEKTLGAFHESRLRCDRHRVGLNCSGHFARDHRDHEQPCHLSLSHVPECLGSAQVIGPSECETRAPAGGRSFCVLGRW
jgi:hypothetical protein